MVQVAAGIAQSMRQQGHTLGTLAHGPPPAARAHRDDQQQFGHVDASGGAAYQAQTDAAAAAIAAAAAAAAAGAEVNASQAMAGVADPAATGDAAAQAAAEAQQAAQLAAANAEAAQQAAQFSQQQLDLLAQGALTLDPATLAAMQALPVSGALPATALQLDPNLAASLLQQGLQLPGLTVVDQNGNMQLMGAEGLQFAGAEMYMAQQAGHDDWAGAYAHNLPCTRLSLAGDPPCRQPHRLNLQLTLPTAASQCIAWGAEPQLMHTCPCSPAAAAVMLLILHTRRRPAAPAD